MRSSRVPPVWAARTLLCLFVVVGGGLSCDGVRPNVVILLADDMGYGDVRAFYPSTPNVSAPTPNLDALMADGAKLDHMLTAAPICTPSRTGLLTGRLPVRAGMASSSKAFRAIGGPAIAGGLPRQEVTLARMLRDEFGYRTAMVGKHHLGIHGETEWNEHLPTRHGFETYYGLPVTNVQTCGGRHVFRNEASCISMFIINRSEPVFQTLAFVAVAAWILRLVSGRTTILFGAALLAALLSSHAYLSLFTLLGSRSCFLMANETVIEQPLRLQNITSRFTHKAIDYIHARGADAQPFFLLVSYAKLHTALFATHLFDGASGAGAYQDNVMEIDWSVGEIREALAEAGLADSTLVFFSSDNGPYLERLEEGGSSGGLRGGKGQTWEGGIRVPSGIVWPEVIPPGTVVSQPVSQMDLVPTVLDILGDSWADREPVLDGVSILGTLKTGADSPHMDRVMFHYCGEDVTSARLGFLKVHFRTPVWDADSDVEACPSLLVCHCRGPHTVDHSPPLLYDLASDPQERTPVDYSDDPALSAVVARISAETERHVATTPHYANQLERMPRPWLLSCCNPPFCSCEEETVPEVVLDI